MESYAPRFTRFRLSDGLEECSDDGYSWRPITPPKQEVSTLPGRYMREDALRQALIAPPPWATSAREQGGITTSSRVSPQDYWMATSSGIAPPITHTDAALKAAVAAAREIERDRILAKLHELRPLDEPYTRRDWALEQRGAKEHHAKLVAAISAVEAKEGE